MARETNIKVVTVAVTPRVSQANKEYTEIVLTDKFGNNYKGILKDGMLIPEIGDYIDIVYQDIKNKFKSIITIKKQGNPPWETSEMTKVITTTRPNKAPFTIKGTLFYAHIKEPDTKGKFPTNKFKTELSISDSTKEALENLGVEVKNRGDEKGNYVVLKSTFQPTVVDPEGAELTAIPLIGNGSKATLTVSTYENKAPKGGKVCLGFSKVVLETLVTYEAKPLVSE